MCYAIPAPHIIYRGALHKEAVLAHDPLVGTHAKHVRPRLVSVAAPTQAAAVHTRTMCSLIVPMKATPISKSMNLLFLVILYTV